MCTESGSPGMLWREEECCLMNRQCSVKVDNGLVLTPCTSYSHTTVTHGTNLGTYTHTHTHTPHLSMWKSGERDAGSRNSHGKPSALRTQSLAVQCSTRIDWTLQPHIPAVTGVVLQYPLGTVGKPINSLVPTQPAGCSSTDCWCLGDG